MGSRRSLVRGAALAAAVVGAAALGWAGWRHGPWRDRHHRRAESKRAPARDTAAARGTPLARAELTGRIARRDLVESSGAAASVAHPGTLYTIADSGNDPTLYAIDVTGADRGAWRLRGATNVDWESVAVGPCAGGATGAPRCVYVGDTGDNDAVYPSRAVYRVAEPDEPRRAGAGEGAVDAERLTYAYADGPRDVEAMYVSADGAVWLVTKRPLAGLGGALRPALVYRIGPEAWATGSSTDRPAVAALVDSLPDIVPGSAPLRVVTDASLAPDGRSLALRTYWQLYVLATDPATGRVRHEVPARVCDLVPLEEEQGEGVAWLADGTLALTTEGTAAPIHVVACGSPPGGAPPNGPPDARRGGRGR